MVMIAKRCLPMLSSSQSKCFFCFCFFFVEKLGIFWMSNAGYFPSSQRMSSFVSPVVNSDQGWTPFAFTALKSDSLKSNLSTNSFEKLFR